jgi:hypothetical protein
MKSRCLQVYCKQYVPVIPQLPAKGDISNPAAVVIAAEHKVPAAACASAAEIASLKTRRTRPAVITAISEACFSIFSQCAAAYLSYCNTIQGAQMNAPCGS